ncbi:ARID DNA-binding domain [Dillenia turbinata]|uniref:ARID DNA-binding domain n=1 Tax=Dillenia turbinata TaxID=194707 RepID=A0AAN8YXP1_9MAGN
MASPPPSAPISPSPEADEMAGAADLAPLPLSCPEDDVVKCETDMVPASASLPLSCSDVVKSENDLVASAAPDSASLPLSSSEVLKSDNEEELKFNDSIADAEIANANQSFLSSDDNDSGTEEEQAAFMKELENFFRETSMEFKPPKFYGEGLNCLKLWRAVIRLGGYDKVTACKLWRQVGESFKPPKTCTTVSWTFRIFYEKVIQA